MVMSSAPLLPGTMPVPRTRLIGREPERAAARSWLLEAAIPLLTLTGPGGTGKTRLVLAIAAEVADRLPDGVIWVDLTSIIDPALVPWAIASALALAPESGASLIESIAGHLAPRRTVLLLDNCEHVLAETAELVAALLGHCPTLQVLATSRAPFHIRGEQVLPVDPLPLPESETASVKELTENESVCLFVERARAARPAFTLDAANARSVAEVCRQLDGLPLAIELAAARSRILPPRALLAQMHERLRWLSDGPRDLPARQRTLRDTIAWSYDLLTDNERQMFRLLAAFVGGSTLAAAQQVVALGGGAPNDVVSAITALVDHGLVRRTGPEEAPRFAMLETIREFGLERLVAAGEADAVRTAHAIVFRDFAEQHHPNRVGSQERVETRLQRIEADLANLRAALVWLAERGEAANLLRLAAALAVFWHLRTHLTEGREWLERALDASPREVSLPRGQAFVGLALILWAQSHYERAALAAQESRAMAQQLGDLELEANALHVLGMIAEIQDRWAEAGEYLRHACAQWRALGAKAEEGWGLTLLCRVSLALGDGVQAARQAEEALALFREIGHPSGIATSLSRLGEIACAQGDLERAATVFRESLQIWSGIGDRWLITLALAGLADVAAAHQQAAVAVTLIGAVDALAQEAGAPLLSAARLSRDRANRRAVRELGGARFARLRAAGLALPLDAAIAAARTITVPGHARHAPGGTDLTPREMEVLRLMARWHTDREIAAMLFLSPRTVGGHVTHILAKLGVSSRRAAAARGRELGLLPDEGQ